MLSFEERALRLQPIDALKSELDVFEVATTLAGRVTYAAAEGFHDDCVMALAMANRQYRAGRGVISNVAVVDYLQNVIRRAYFEGGQLQFD